MRVGVSSRGNVWLSMGPAGWLILGPFIAAGYLLLLAVALVFWLASAAVRALSEATRR